MDKKCTIYSVAVSKQGTREAKTKTVLYDQIKCDFYQPSSGSKFAQTNELRESPRSDYEVVLKGSCIDVKKGMSIELFDVGSKGLFIIASEPEIYRHASGVVSNITLQVTLE